MSDIAMSFFSAGSMMISVFTTIQVFAWVATIWKGRPVATTSLYYAVASVMLLVIGGLSGVFTGVIPADWQVHNTYYVVAHIHYVLIGANVFPVFAAFYYWLPKMTGRMMNERLGKWSFWIMFVGFNVGFFPMHNLGLMGMPRRIFTYQEGLGFDDLNMVVTAGAFTLGIGILLGIVNLLVSLRSGRLAGPNPWNSDGLEWSIDSPPPPYGSAHIPVVVSRHPLWDDFAEEEDPENDRVLDWGRLTPTTSSLDSEPMAIATIPEDSLAPLLMSLTLFGFFLTFVFQMVWAALGFVVGTFLLGCFWMWPRTEKEIV
jgi:cytochrome c oxidase subunit 1/cytochrome c oxidase subunit I+III